MHLRDYFWLPGLAKKKKKKTTKKTKKTSTSRKNTKLKGPPPAAFELVSKDFGTLGSLSWLRQKLKPAAKDSSSSSSPARVLVVGVLHPVLATKEVVAFIHSITTT